MLKVGLTGGIAAGKSVVGEMLAAMGALVIQADQISHQLMKPGAKVYEEVVRRFGAAILSPDGRINRAQLAELAFGSDTAPSRVDELNAIVHPAVIRKQEEWLTEMAREHPQGIAIVEAALILEAGMKDCFDRLIVVTCRPEQRIARWMKRAHTDETSAGREVARRMAAQLSDEEKIRSADYVIDNSGVLDDTRQQVEEVFVNLQHDIH